MSNGRAFDTPCIYQIRVMGNLDSQWSDWLDGFAITTAAHGETLLTGQIRDQAALYGLLAKMGNIGLSLLSVTRTGYETLKDKEQNHEHNG